MFLAHHGTPPPGVTDRDVYLLDFAYPRPTCLDLARQARSFLVLDHHKTALEELGDLPFLRLDLQQSGAGLAWRYFHPHEPVPRLVLTVEDGDLWRHEMPETRAIYLRLTFEPRTFDNWNEIARQTATDTGLRAFAEEGRPLLEEREFQVERLLLKRYQVVLDGERGLAAEGEAFYRSELGHRLAQLSGTYGLVWYPRSGGYHVSLRSIGDYDVERLARRFGGGGHRNAADFTLEDRSLLRVVMGDAGQRSDR
jgi:oligoribonuclease NrnB/cAMP/cGMP phosphodiesterase (DHH superfamily)